MYSFFFSSSITSENIFSAASNSSLFPFVVSLFLFLATITISVVKTTNNTDMIIIKLRFLGINTRESTIEEEPWGKAASDYVKARLKNAKTIILDANGATKDMYGRYLGLVWVDGILLNLEIIDQAYSNSTLSISDSRYGEVFMKASIAAKKTGRRFFGEIDPDYDYENKRFK